MYINHKRTRIKQLIDLQSVGPPSSALPKMPNFRRHTNKAIVIVAQPVNNTTAKLKLPALTTNLSPRKSKKQLEKKGQDTTS